MELDNKAIKEVNIHISDALNQWSKIMLLSDSDNWAYKLEYSDEDVFNAVYIVNHVLMNRAIKNGHIANENDALRMGTEFKKAIREYCGIDTIELSKELSKKWKLELEE